MLSQSTLKWFSRLTTITNLVTSRRQSNCFGRFPNMRSVETSTGCASGGVSTNSSEQRNRDIAVPSTIAILEDDSRRVAAMQSCLQRLYPWSDVVLFDGAPEMICWLKMHLADSVLICLDHDLGANRIIDGNLQDPGTGRDVADYLSDQKPCCPVIIHSSNMMAAGGDDDGLGRRRMGLFPPLAV
jgi:hypothetical protein